MLPAVADHLVPAVHELAAAVERQVERVREALVVVRDVLAEELVEQLLAQAVREALLQRALHEHGRRPVVAVRRGVLRPDSIGVVGGVEDPAPERLVIRRRREQELRALHVERSTLDDRAAGWAEDTGQAALPRAPARRRRGARRGRRRT